MSAIFCYDFVINYWTEKVSCKWNLKAWPVKCILLILMLYWGEFIFCIFLFNMDRETLQYIYVKYADPLYDLCFCKPGVGHKGKSCTANVDHHIHVDWYFIQSISSILIIIFTSHRNLQRIPWQKKCWPIACPCYARLEMGWHMRMFDLIFMISKYGPGKYSYR